MGKGGGSQTTVQKTEIPGYIQTATQDLLGKVKAFQNEDYQSYTGDRVSDLSSDQETAFQRIRNMVANTPQVGGQALAGARNYAAAPAQQISNERIVDESGRLGAFSDYMNPYVDATLNPVIGRIMESAEKFRNQLGGNAAQAGAFGDARHGIVESELNRDTQRNIGEAASNVYMNAFNNAMGLRANDLGRMTDVDTQNANYLEQALQRQLVGSGELISRAQADQNRLTDANNQLLTSGSLQQAQTQAELDAAYEDFLRKYEDEFAKFGVYNSALGNVPFPTTTTSTTSGGGGGGAAQAFGSIAAALITKI